MDIFDNKKLNELASEILGWISSGYLLDDGLLSSGIIDGKKSHKDILCDLGDYLPFLYIFGAKELCGLQLEALKKKLSGGLLPPTQQKLRMPVVTSYAHTDLMLGLIDYYELSGNPEALQLIREIFPVIISRFRLNRLPRSFFMPGAKIVLPVLDTRDATFIELMVGWNKVSGEKEYLEMALNLFDALTNLSFFQKNSLFPKFAYVGPGAAFINLSAKFNKVVLMKHNTNALFAFLELWKATGQEEVKSVIYRIIESIFEKLYKNGLIYNNFSGDTELTANFSMIDFLCDSAKIFKDVKLGKYAEEIANFWLIRQSKKTGLFPKTASAKEDDLDCCTDMIVALMKLFEVSGQDRYKSAAEHCFLGVVNYHRKSGGYFLSVDIDTGEVADSQFKTKFITLFLKTVYLFLEKEKIYGNEKIFNILKDR